MSSRPASGPLVPPTPQGSISSGVVAPRSRKKTTASKVMAVRKTKARAQSEADEQRGRGGSFNGKHFLCSFLEESFDADVEHVKKNDHIYS